MVGPHRWHERAQAPTASVAQTVLLEDRGLRKTKPGYAPVQFGATESSYALNVYVPVVAK